MEFKKKLAESLFGGTIAALVQERMSAASVTDDDKGWKKLTGDASRNLDVLKQERMIEIAFWLWENNPMAKWLIEIIKDFILADGLPFKAGDPEVKTVLNNFWFDPLNRMDLYLEKHVRELFLFGELCLPVFTAEQTGKVRLGYIDPIRIKDVVTDPENVKIIIGVVLKDTLGNEGKKMKTILPADAEDILSDKAQALRDSYGDRECFFFSINNVTNSPRGRSELLPIADWLDAYEQFLFDYADKWPLMNAFVWDLLIDGADEAECKKQASAFTKKSGSVFAHNEKVTLTASAPKLQAYEAETGARLFRNHIMGALSLPEHWYGGGGDVNRATAVEMGTPAFKSLDSKQRYFKYILETIFEHVIASSRAANYLKVDDEAARDYSVVTPELVSKDLEKNASAIQKVVTSMAQARREKWIDEETAVDVLTTLIGQLGIDINSEDLRARLKKEQSKEGYEDYEEDEGKNAP